MASRDGQAYIPGVCNIGPAERRRRRAIGIFGTVITVILLAALLITNAPWGCRFVLLVPAALAANGFLQDRLHFCVGFGLLGIFNVINSAGVTDNVELEQYRQADRRKAIQIVLYSGIIGLAVTGLSLLIS